jgi:hypothetical protein
MPGLLAWFFRDWNHRVTLCASSDGFGPLRAAAHALPGQKDEPVKRFALNLRAWEYYTAQ